MGEGFEVIHPFHPLHGRRFRLVSRWKHWGGDRVLFEEGDGPGRSLPTAWTSIARLDPFVTISAGRSFCRTEDLLALVALIEKLSTAAGERKEDSAVTVSQNSPAPSQPYGTERK